MIDIKGFSELISLVFAAAADARKWPDFLEGLSRLSGGVKAQIIGYDTQTGASLGQLTQGYDLAKYVAFCSDTDGWEGMFEVGPLGEETDLRDAFLQRDPCNEAIRQAENIFIGCGMVLFCDGKRFFAIGGAIRQCDLANLEKPFLDLIHLLAPHLRDALNINRSFAEQNQRTKPEDLYASNAATVLIASSSETELEIDRAMVANPLIPLKTNRKKYGLSQRELENAVLLSKGQTMREIAVVRGVSLNTVRNQIKSAMSKMDVHRQMDLIRVLKL